ncbi:MAG: hypothetical protein KGZ86_07915 [Candidatus Latescibacteria bacterium]|nr:hypothetical protein [Candidatus Latescibacterota bacterium]
MLKKIAPRRFSKTGRTILFILIIIVCLIVIYYTFFVLPKSPPDAGKPLGL